MNARPHLGLLVLLKIYNLWTKKKSEKKKKHDCCFIHMYLRTVKLCSENENDHDNIALIFKQRSLDVV